MTVGGDTLSASRTARRAPVVERPGADRVEDDRDAELVRDEHLPQVLRGVAIVEDAAAAEDEEIEPLDLGVHLPARQGAGRDGALDLVSGQRVRGVPREHGDVRGDGRPQLAEDPLEDRLVAEVHPAVRPEIPIRSRCLVFP